MTTRPTAAARTAAALTLGAVGLLTLAGCTTSDSPAGAGGGNGGSGSTSDTPYTDGTYEATGSYQSPHGTESVDVTVTLKDDVVTDVTVVGHADNPDTTHYQGEFVAGIADVVVGKDIDEISVDRVGGSSLTSGGFRDALEQIKAKALA